MAETKGISLQLPLNMHARLKEQKEATGAPVAETIRRAVEAYLSKAEAKRKEAAAG